MLIPSHLIIHYPCRHMARWISVTHALVNQPATPPAALSIPSSALLFTPLPLFIGFSVSSYFTRMDANPLFTRWALGCMHVANRRRQMAILTGSPPHLWGGTRGLREALSHLTSTYIIRDIARCRPLALHYRCMKLKGPNNGLNGAQSAPKQTFVVLTERQRHAHYGRP
jgi:hypothetical protein